MVLALVWRLRISLQQDTRPLHVGISAITISPGNALPAHHLLAEGRRERFGAAGLFLRIRLAFAARRCISARRFAAVAIASARACVGLLPSPLRNRPRFIIGGRRVTARAAALF